MGKSSLSKYEVTNIPVAIKPIFYLYCSVMVLAMLSYAVLVHVTSKIQITGKENLSKTSNYIFCHWHTFTPLYFCVFMRKSSQVWMQHPVWFMKPIHIVLRITGVERIVLGSTGHSGRNAAKEIVEYLKMGYSTVVLPDGPKGPPFIMKKGILHMAKQSQVPIVPIRFDVKRFVELNTWDRKKWPFPFSIIKAQFGKPIKVTDSNFKEVFDYLTMALGPAVC